MVISSPIIKVEKLTRSSVVYAPYQHANQKPPQTNMYFTTEHQSWRNADPTRPAYKNALRMATADATATP